MLVRKLSTKLDLYLQQFPAVGITGPRQVGKSTLARELIGRRPDALYLDLERPSHQAKLQDPEAYFALHREALICLDEVQLCRRSSLFCEASSTKQPNRPGQFLLLGSAAPDLVRDRAETLAGRIGYLELTGFSLRDGKIYSDTNSASTPRDRTCAAISVA